MKLTIPLTISLFFLPSGLGKCYESPVCIGLNSATCTAPDGRTFQGCCPDGETTGWAGEVCDGTGATNSTFDIPDTASIAWDTQCVEGWACTATDLENGFYDAVCSVSYVVTKREFNACCPAGVTSSYEPRTECIDKSLAGSEAASQPFALGTAALMIGLISAAVLGM